MYAHFGEKCLQGGSDAVRDEVYYGFNFPNSYKIREGKPLEGRERTEKPYEVSIQNTHGAK